MNIIVAADENWAIGNRGELLIRIPNDRKQLQRETAGKVVVMGRKTLDLLFQGIPPQTCTSMVLSRNPSCHVKGAQVVHSLEELLQETKKYRDEDVYVIGGESVYRQLLPYCNVAHVTRIDHAYAADLRFPDLDADSEWEITADSEEQTYFDIPYQFVKYERR